MNTKRLVDNRITFTRAKATEAGCFPVLTHRLEQLRILIILINDLVLFMFFSLWTQDKYKDIGALCLFRFGFWFCFFKTKS